MIAAIAELRRQGRDLHAALLEPGRNTSAIWRHITARHVQPCISLMNDAGLWEKVLPEVDACVVPAPQYELTIVPLLAMALGKLVIAARDQPAEWFLEDRTAWQFTPGSAVELAYLLVRAIEQPRRVEETGQRAAEYVRVHHSVRELVTTLTGLYRLLWTRSGDVVPPEQPR
jgi:glycosyltransferase involved in cell wall biosynthesis